MVVQHNLTAMNSNRMLGITTGQQAKSSEKLSSGYRINRAADDAAGLSISEKMRKQIRGLDQASTNAQDGVSAVQTAEGALTEVHSMLQRMNELAVQASNGTNSESDRQAIQDEIAQLTTEIDRVAETTKFNDTYLLKGDKDGAESEVRVNAHDAGLLGKLTDKGTMAEFELKDALEKGDTVTIAGKEYTIGDKGAASTNGYSTFDGIKDEVIGAGDTITLNDGTTHTVVDKIAVADNWNNGTKFTITGKDGKEVEYTVAAATDHTKNEIKASDVEKLIQDALDLGGKVTMTAYNDGANTVDVNAEVVETLLPGELSSVVLNGKTLEEVVTGLTQNGGLGKPAADVDSVTINGEETVITDKTPVSSADIADVIGSMVAGDKIKIGNTEITIGNKTDALNDVYTITDALALIEDGDQVEFAIAATNQDGLNKLAEKGLTNSTAGNMAGTNAVTVVGVGANTDSEDVITVAEAYAKMAEELQKASSIGADEAAKVTNHGNGKFTIEKGTTTVTDSLSFNLHVGADADMTNKITVGIDSMDAAGLGIKGLNVADDTGMAATYAVDAIADAVSKVSAQRSALGAVQNRLEHTIDNLDNVVENTTAAESRIRDTDMAEEMVEYSKNNILAQAGQSMLAQANQATQGVLSLLQ